MTIFAVCKDKVNGNCFFSKKLRLSYGVASGGEIRPCNKIIKLVVYRFSGNVMTSIKTLRTY